MAEEFTDAFHAYWPFAAERQSIYYKRLRGEKPPWTKNKILEEYKFTNAFRAADRTSQYLIREVIYKPGLPMEAEEVVFRVLLFKIFNKNETWDLLTSALGPLTWKGFNLKTYGATLDAAKARKIKIWGDAYIQRPQTGFDVDAEKKEVKGKHNRYLRLLEAMMSRGITGQLQAARTYEEAYHVLRDFPSPAIGNFAAMQWLTDINYSPVLNFDEDDFIVPGDGAFDGINKAFGFSLDGNREEDIRTGAAYIQECVRDQEAYFKHYELQPVTLFGRRLHAIDCQNLFCETDKYCRVAFPKLNRRGRTDIKHKFKPSRDPLPPPFFPKKWGLDTSRIPPL
jgi:alpha-glutamyl/putrescinyl thymine pyrophosphorylase clade 1